MRALLLSNPVGFREFVIRDGSIAEETARVRCCCQIPSAFGNL